MHPHHHDQYARGVVVCCEDAVTYLACVLALLTCLLAPLCLLACLVGWLVN